MTARDEPAALSALANALQAAVPLVDRLRVTTRQQIQDCHAARIALERAVEALRQLQPGPQTGGTP